MHKLGYRIIATVLVGILLTLFAAVIVIQIPAAQRRIANGVLAKLSETFKGNVQVGSINIRPSGALYLKDILVIDREPYSEDVYDRGWAPVDTFFQAGSISATISMKSLFSKGCIRLNRVNIDNAMMHLVTEPADNADGKTSNIQRIFNLPPPKTDMEADPPGGPDLFEIRKVRINGFRFRLTSFLEKKKDYPGFGINYEDMDAMAEEISVRRMKFAGGVMSGIADRIVLSEKCGYRATVTGKCSAGMGKVLVDDLRLKDEWTDLDLRFFMMTFRNGVAFRDFLNRIRMEARFRPSHVAMQTIAYVGSGQLNGNQGVYEISGGHVLGFVSDMAIEDFAFKESYSRTSGQIEGRIYGLPDIDKFGIDAKVKDFRFDTGGLSRFINSWSRGGRADFSSIAKGMTFRLNATARGLLNNLAVKGRLDSPAGSVDISGSLADILDKRKAMKIIASAGTSSLDAGRILSSDALGEVEFKTSARLALVPGDMQLVVDSVRIARARVLGYEYSNIYAGARIEDNNLWARLEARDSNVAVKMLANADLKPKDGKRDIKLGVDLDTLRMDRLNLTKTGEDINLKLGIDVNMSVLDSLFLDGTVKVSGITLTDSNGDYPLEYLLMKAGMDGRKQNIDIISTLFNLSLVSDKNVTALVPDLLNASLRRDLAAFCPAKENPEKPGNHSLKLEIYDTNEVTDYFFPGTYIENGTTFTAELKEDGVFKASLLSGRIASGLTYLKDLDLKADNLDGKLSARLAGSEFNTSLFKLNNPEVSLTADDNFMDMKMQFHGGVGEDDCAEIMANATATRNEEGKVDIIAHTKPSYIKGSQQVWNMDESDINVAGKTISVRNFLIHSGDQRLSVEGGINTGKRDSLSIWMSRFNLGSMNQFIQKQINLKGFASGGAVIRTEPDADAGMLLNFSIDSLGIGGHEVGDFKAESHLADNGRDIVAHLDNMIGGRKAMDINGLFSPEEKKMDLKADIDKFNLAALTPLFSNIFTEMNGSVSGRFNLYGDTKDLDVSSEGAYFNDVMLRLTATGALYTLNGPLSVDKKGIRLDGIAISDDDGGKGYLDGNLAFNDFKQMGLDAAVSFDRLKVVDSPETALNSFYGHMKASGKANVSGPLNALNIDADITTDGEGDIHVPLSGKLSSTRGELLTYVDHSIEDPYEKMLKKYLTREKISNDIRIKAKVAITEGLNAFMEIDKSVGNIISFGGDGHVNLEVRPSKDIFNLDGDYIISRGKYHFVLPGILEKDLNINNGSSVRFGGDLMDSQIDITAIYNLKTSLGTLIADTTKVSTRKNVEAGLTISNKLSNPDLNFFINVPDLDPTTKSRVDACLNTEDKVQKQFVALLLLGSFIPSEQYGVFNGANMLYSNVGEIVSGQLNSILSKLNIPVDLGLSYQQNSVGNNIFDVAVSTQLFNNRVTVSGNVGNRQYKPTSAATGDMVGDIDIEVKIDEAGKFRVKLFSHSADSYSNFLDNFQRNGLGFSYQKDFIKKTKEGEDGFVTLKIEE